MAAPYLLAELLSAQSRDQLRAKFLAILGADPNVGLGGTYNHGFPVADWLSNPAGMEMAFVNMVRGGIYDLIASGMGKQIAGGWLARATGDWLTFHASMFYEVERNPPTKTVFKLKLSNAGSAPPYDFAVGDVWVLGASGHRYVSITAGHLEAGGELVLSFEAEFAGAASNDNPITSPPALVTAFAGVTVSASVAAFSDVYQQGDGTGHVTFTPVNINALPGTYTVRIDVSGNIGTARWSLSNDGVTFESLGVVQAIQDPNFALNIIPTAGGTSPSFLAGDLYTATAPGGTGYVQGSDEEADASLRERCRARWPSISLNQTSAVFVLWTKLAAPSVNRVAVRADPLVPGRAQIVAADSHGGVDQAVITVIAAYINPRLGDVLESISVAPARNRPVNTGGVVYVTALTAAAIQQATVDGWNAYLATVPIGGTVLLSELEQLIMDAGARDLSLTLDETIENVTLGRDEIPVATNILTDLTWLYV